MSVRFVVLVPLLLCAESFQSLSSVKRPSLKKKKTPMYMSNNKAFRILGESTRYTVSGAVAATLVLRHDAATLGWVLGAVAASAANKGLKKIIKQARPGDETESVSTDGMPSSHACAMANLGTSVLTNTWVSLQTPWWCPLDRWSVTALLVAYFLTSVSWRVAAKYHTTPQILVGTAFGASTSFAWRHLWLASGLSHYATQALNGGVLTSVGVIAALIAGAIVVLGFDDLLNLLQKLRRPPPE